MEKIFCLGILVRIEVRLGGHSDNLAGLWVDNHSADSLGFVFFFVFSKFFSSIDWTFGSTVSATSPVVISPAINFFKSKKVRRKN